MFTRWLGLLAIVAAARLAAEEEGFKPLWNGKDLTGWVNVNGAPDTWTVKDGLIVCTGKPIAVMRTERQYENFIVELEWRHMKKEGNSGFFIWSDPVTAKGQPFTRAIECQILDGRESANYTSDGDVFAIHGAEMTPDRPHPAGWARCLPSEKRAKPSPEWNHYRITCKDGTIKLAVNGKEVSGGYDIHPRKGYLCLESEGSEAHFRNLRIHELPPSKEPLKPEDVAQVDEGFKALYTGLDLSGWKAGADAEGHWKPDDWKLAFDGKGGSLWTKEEFADFVLIVDCRSPAVPKPGDGTRVGEFAVLLRGKCPIVFPAAKSTEWRRAVITVKGDLVKAELDGKPLGDVGGGHCAVPGGPIGLGSEGGAAEYANVYVKKL